MTLEELFFNTSVFRVYVGPYSYGELNYCDRLHILITFIYIITPLLTSTHKPVLARALSSIEENRCFGNGGTNLHIHAIVQDRPEDNQVEFLQGPHGIVNPPKNLVLNNIHGFTMEHIRLLLNVELRNHVISRQIVI